MSESRFNFAEVERPLTPPEVGAKTAQAVLEMIRLHPEMHDQWSWGTCLSCDQDIDECVCVAGTACDTALCVAGWTQWLHEGRVVINELDGSGVFPEENYVKNRATRYLDIGSDDGNRLFSSELREVDALTALEYLARGERIDWAEIFGDNAVCGCGCGA